MVCQFLQLVLWSSISLRAASRVMETMGEESPHWTSGRLWLLRLGHAALAAPLRKADDWVWLADHSVQIGRDKVLLILGMRLSRLPLPERCLSHEDLAVVALVPASRWTRPAVAEALEAAAERTGVPRVIVDDHGVDLSGGVEIFRGRHTRTSEVYDIRHKGACLLKHRLEKEEAWGAFCSQAAAARCAVQQTEMAFLTPPCPRPKARFMNLGPLVAWGRGVLGILRFPRSLAAWGVSEARLEEKLGWVGSFARRMGVWSAWQELIERSIGVVGREGIYRGLSVRLERRLSGLTSGGEEERAMADDLVRFARSQEEGTRRGERLPGSTDAIESCFGRFKRIEGQQSKGGFTSLVLALGAMVGRMTPQRVHAALRRSSTADVREWASQKLGTTVFAKRRLACQGATELG